jgi:hypothetical protein
MKTGICAVFTFCAAVGLATPATGPGRPTVPVTLARAFDEDDWTMLYDNRPMILLRTHSHRAANSDWLKFETDACGWLQRVDNSHSMLRQSALGGDSGDLDEDEPWDNGRGMAGQWLSQHSEIAVINDAVDKSCDDSVFDDEDEDTLEIA